MALSWKYAQKSEKAFYDRIYKKGKYDINSYRPVTNEECVTFSKKTIERFGYTFNKLKGKVLADVGCGPYGIVRGIVLYAGTNKSLPERMYAIDSLMETYKKYGLLKNNDVTELINSKAESIPLDAQSCDYVFCTNAIDHVDKPESVIKEAKRICSQEGTFCMSLHVVNTPFGWMCPFLFLVDKNHPHHFRKNTILKLARKYFTRVTVCNRVSVLEDQPEFKFTNIFKAKHKLRAIKRWVSTLIFSSIYMKCEK